MFDSLAFQLAKPQVWLGLAATALVAYAIYRLGRLLLRRLTPYLPARVRPLLGWLWGLSLALGWLAVATRVIYLPEVPLLFDLGGSVINGLRNSAGQTLVVLALGFIAWNLVGEAAGRIVTGDEFSRRSVRMQTLKGVVESTLKVVIVVVCAISLLQTLGINATSLLAGVSVVGVAVGFGAQSLVRDVFTGFFILLEDQYGVGDVITVNTGQLSGNVEHLNLRITTLRALDGTVHIIPNGQIQTVSVSSKDWSRVVATVDVTYGADIDAALRVLDEVSQALYRDPEWSEYFLAEPEIQGVTALAPDGVTLRALYKVQPKSQFALGREFNRRIKLAMDAAQIEIPSPQRTLTFSQGPVEVRLTGEHASPAPASAAPANPAQAHAAPSTPSPSPVKPSFTRDPDEPER